MAADRICGERTGRWCDSDGAKAILVPCGRLPISACDRNGFSGAVRAHACERPWVSAWQEESCAARYGSSPADLVFVREVARARGAADCLSSPGQTRAGTPPAKALGVLFWPNRRTNEPLPTLGSWSWKTPPRSKPHGRRSSRGNTRPAVKGPRAQRIRTDEQPIRPLQRKANRAFKDFPVSPTLPTLRAAMAPQAGRLVAGCRLPIGPSDAIARILEHCHTYALS